MPQIAIVIPAYKPDFLPMTLESLCNQTNKNFNVYIGDDNSPYDLKPIIDKYKSKLNLTYKNFDENLGGKDLVAQWQRCIALSKDEEWIWLFSDDDVMSENSIDEVYKQLEKGNKDSIYRLDVDVIDKDGNKIRSVSFPRSISAKDLYKKKLLGKAECYVVEYIFSRDVYERSDGFINFDLAWGSDLASWIKFSQNKPIKTIPNTKIYWRSSGENISTLENPQIIKRKIEALISFLKWGEGQFSGHDIRLSSDIGLAKRLLAFDIDRSISNKYINIFTNNKIRRSRIKTLVLLGKILKRHR